MVKEFQHKNLWALILGGSSGLGLATAQKLAQHGMHICVVYRATRNQKDAIQQSFETIKNEGVKVVTINTDAFNSEKRAHALAQLKLEMKPDGAIKILVHSVAKGNLKPMLSDQSATLKNDDFMLTINAMGISLYDWVKDVFTNNMFAKDARIISFTSEGNKKPLPNYAAVSAAKATLETITRSIAVEFAPHGVKANCIQAGVTDTASLRMIPGSDKLMDLTKKRNPNKRLTTPEDIANVVYLLSKDEAKWITGTVIPVDGGEHLR